MCQIVLLLAIFLVSDVTASCNMNFDRCQAFVQRYWKEVTTMKFMGNPGSLSNEVIKANISIPLWPVDQNKPTYKGTCDQKLAKCKIDLAKITPTYESILDIISNPETILRAKIVTGSNTARTTVVTQENEYTKLECPGQWSFIVDIEAFYGIDNESSDITCGTAEKERFAITAQVKSWCEYKEECYIWASNYITEDPCPMVTNGKYLEVSYNCMLA